MGGVAASSPVAEESPRSNDQDAFKTPISPEPKRVGAEGASESEGIPKDDNEKQPLGNITGEEGDPEEGRPGLIQDDGSINWDCPCLGGMAHGPCGDEFRAAFSCFHYSTAEQKGSDCLEPFMAMQSCFQKYPEIFGPKLTGEEDDFDESSIPLEQKSEKEVDHENNKQKRLSDSEKNSVQLK